ncbi:hypothetical protein C8A05DRAFT_20540, partial [Staphylotrichum tortipilum]
IKRMARGIRNPEGTVSAAEWPKYNFQMSDLDNVLIPSGQVSTHERERVQFHFLLDVFCWSGARIGAFFRGGGLKYKDVNLVLRRTNQAGAWDVIWKLDQRFVKNALHPDDIAHSMTGRQHGRLRYNDGFFLLAMAIADGALFGIHSLDDLWEQRIIDGDNEMPLLWNESASALPIARRVEHGKVTLQPMSEWRFRRMFDAVLTGSDYVGIRPSVHQIRRETAGKLNSAHVLHYHPGIFDAFYAGNVSSCDGGAAFRNEEPDHSVPEYFRGIGQFRELGAPTQLPASMDSAIQQNPAVVELDTQARDAATSAERTAILIAKKNLLKKLRREGLASYRNGWLTERRKAKILSRGTILPCTGREPDPLNELIPEKGRLATCMARNSNLTEKELYGAMRDMLYLLTEDWTVLYRPGDKPNDGLCPVCNEELSRIDERQRWRHIHNCRRHSLAEELDIKHHDLVYCFYCSEWFQRGDDWEAHCLVELKRPPSKRYGAVIYRHTIILPTFCLFCRQSEDRLPSERLQYWERDADAIRHILETHELPTGCLECGVQSVSLEHLYDVHGYRASSGRFSHEITAPGDEPGPPTVPPGTAKVSTSEWWYGGGDVDMISGPGSRTGSMASRCCGPPLIFRRVLAMPSMLASLE